MTVFHGTKHDDTFNESTHTTSDTFDLYKGGNDIVIAGSGDDVFKMGAALNAGDRLDGGAGRDLMFLRGDYSAGVTFVDQTIRNIEAMKLGAGFSYDLTTADGNVAAGSYMSVDARALGASYSLTFDGSAELDGHYILYGGAGNDMLTGGALADKFRLEKGGNDTAHGGGGNDTFVLGGAFTTADVIDGGLGSDTLSFNGTYTTLALSATAVTNVEKLTFLGSHNYVTVSVAGNIAGGATLNVDATGAARINSFDLTAATSTGYAITAGNGFKGFLFGSNFSSAVSVTGGDATHLVFNGDYAGAITFSGTELTSITGLQFRGDHSYTAALVGDINLGANSGGVSIGANLSTGRNAFIDLTQATTSFPYTVTDSSGNVTVKFAGNFNASDRFVYSGHVSDVLTVELDGDYSSGVTITGTTFDGVNTLKLDDGFSYTLTMSGNNAGIILAVDAGALTAGHTLNFDGTGASSGLAVTGGAGNDILKFGGNFGASDTFNGGAGNDTLSLNGDYSAGYTFGASQLASVENIAMADGHTYSLTTKDANVASGATLTIDASALTGSNQLFFDGTSETDGHFAFISGASDDVIEGGKLSDTFDMSRSNGAFVSGFDGNDSFTFTAAANLLSDSVDGGAGSDTLILNGDFSTQTALTGSNLTSIEALQLLGSTHSYNLTFADGVTTALSVDASAALSLIFSGAGDNNTAFTIIGSAGDDHVIGGNKGDHFTGGAGEDVFAYSAVGQSASTHYDTIADFAAGTDQIDVATTVTSIFTVSGTVNSATFDTDLHNLGAVEYQGATVLTVTGGDLTGHTFLVIDGDGDDVYTGGQDYVIDITGYTGTITTGDFV